MKKIWKKAVSMALVLALPLGGLTACGKGGDPMENAALAKENVYRYQEIQLPEFDADYVTMRGSCKSDGKFYMILETDDWDNGLTNYMLLSMNEDGTDVQQSSLEEPQMPTFDLSQTEGGESDGENDADSSPAEEEENVTEDDTENVTEDDAEDGTESGDLASDEDLAADDSAIGMPVPDESYNPSDIWENTYFSNFVFGNDSIYGTVNHVYEDYSDPENYISLNETYLCRWNMDGSLQWMSQMEGMQNENEWVYVSSMIPGPDGSLTMLLMGDAGYKMVADAEGNVGEREASLSEETYTILNNNLYMLPKEDGTLLIIYSDENDWNKKYAAVYDPVKDSFGESVELPSSFSYNVNMLTAGLNSDLIYTNSSGIWSYNLGDEQAVKKMDYINSDMDVSSFDSVAELDENTFIGLFTEGDTWPYETKAGLFTYVKPEDVPDKKVLVLAGNYPSDVLRRRVIDFNRSSDEYRVIVKSYDLYNSYEDYYAGYTQLNNDIITGNMPDILIADSNLPVENYIAKGLIADVGKMIADDEELSQVEFVQNVFDAYSVDGTLYHVIPSFSVQTLIGKTSIVGDRSTWTMEDMMQLASTLPEGTSMIGDLTRGYFFNMMMNFCGTDFVDVETGKCNFDTPGFISTMEYAKTLPEEIVYDDDYWSQNWEAQYREDRTVLCNIYISDMSNLNYMINGNFGEDVSFIGFPTESGQGSILSANEAYCISSKSANKEGAWEFLRYYLTDEYQDTITYGLPIQKDNFEAQAQKATQRPYYIDSETGEKVEYDETFYMNGEEIILEPMSQAQVDEIVEFIYSVDKIYYYNQNIQDIINEEIEGFYAGQKSAEEVAKIIQSRAQVYVDENR